MVPPNDDQVVNSVAYWARRHRTNWKENEGCRQTLFFSEVAIDNSPLWFLSELSSTGMSVCDVGCALGQGTVALAKALPGCSVRGVDFSEPAISQARHLFPTHDFEIADLLELGEDFDVLFLSNILEHFDDPWSVLDTCAEHARRYLWLMVPFYEEDPGTIEHQASFSYDNIAATIGHDFTLCFAKEIDLRNVQGTLWHGDQLVLIYARECELDTIAPHWCEIRREGDPASFVMPSQRLATRRLAELSLSQAGTRRLIRDLSRKANGLASPFGGAGEGAGVANSLAEDSKALLAAIEALTSDRQKAVEAAAEASERLQTIDAHYEQIIVEIKGDAESRHQELMAKNEDQIRSYQVKLDDAWAQYRKLKEENLSLEQKLEDELQRMQSLATAHAEEIAELRHEIDGWSQAYRAERISMESEIERAVQVVQQYQTSRSWRLTRPLREGARRLKKLLRREGAAFHDAQFLPVLPPRKIPSPDGDNPEPSLTTAVRCRSERREFLDFLAKRVASARLLFVQSRTIPWRVPLFQRPQHMARALARNGAVSVYFSFGDEWADDYQELEENVFLVRDNEMLQELRGAAVSYYSTSPAHSPGDYRRVLDAGNVLIYEYIDHISAEISGEENIPRLTDLFDTAVESADLIAVSARNLMNDIPGGAESDRVFYLPNAVDLEHYERARVDGRKTIPKPLRDILARGRPIIGYFGAIAPWLWYEALDEMARRRSRYEFVLLGPDYFGGSKNLPDRSNVHWLGTVDYHDLPLWAQHFDVAMIPFSPGDVARTTSPLKLFEYFALGKPVVVSSEMNECTAFDEVFSGDGPEELAVALDSALEACEDHGYVERILHLAEQNSWGHRAATMLEQIERRFRERDR